MTLYEWKRSVKPVPSLPTTLAFVLDHEYSEANLRLDRLKGHDQQVGQHLGHVCAQLGFHSWLANIENSFTGAVDDEVGGADYDSLPRNKSKVNSHQLMDRTIMSSTILKMRMFRDDGFNSIRDISFDERLFIQGNPFRDKDPEKEDPGFTGDKGTCATQTYHRAVRDFTVFFMQALTLERLR